MNKLIYKNSQKRDFTLTAVYYSGVVKWGLSCPDELKIIVNNIEYVFVYFL